MRRPALRTGGVAELLQRRAERGIVDGVGASELFNRGWGQIQPREYLASEPGGLSKARSRRR